MCVDDGDRSGRVPQGRIAYIALHRRNDGGALVWGLTTFRTPIEPTTIIGPYLVVVTAIVTLLMVHARFALF
jgi:hypothetical protein